MCRRCEAGLGLGRSPSFSEEKEAKRLLFVEATHGVERFAWCKVNKSFLLFFKKEMLR
jgi:hypothetical protein